MTGVPESRYLHGTAPEEQERLALMNRLLNHSSLRELSLRPGERILEVGSGLGQFAREMARQVGPGGRVLGIERSGEQIAEGERRARREGEEGLIEMRRGEALTPPLAEAEWGSFDVAHARFLLEHVPDPLGVVRAMVRAVRPGGRIVLEDDDHDVLRLWPEPPGFTALWCAYTRTFDRLGNDAYVGRRLVALLKEAGATPRRVTSLFYGACPGMANFEGTVENVIALLVGARDPIVTGGLLDSGFFEEAVGALRKWVHRPDAAFWYNIPWAEGVRPA